jgi:hypothetical protein
MLSAALKEGEFMRAIGCALALSILAIRSAHAETAQQAFDKMKSLIGEWQAPLAQNETMIDIFRPIAFGTAILHEEWKNGEQLTATVFYVDGSELRADHYCDMGNQLHYVVKAFTDPNVLDFQLQNATNLDTHPRHFHSTVWRYVDANHHDQDWELMSADQSSKVIHLKFTRTKGAGAS